MADGLRFPELRVPAVSRQPALILRPWRAADIPALAAEMSRDYLLGGMSSRRRRSPARHDHPAGARGRAAGEHVRARRDGLGDDPPADLANALQTLVSRARRALDGAAAVDRMAMMIATKK